MNKPYTLFQNDCLLEMKKMGDKSIDLVLTDPPYGIGIAKNPFRQKFEKKQWDNFTPTKEYFEEIIRVSKHQIIWGGNYFSDFLPTSRCFYVWDKIQSENFSSAMCEMAWVSKQAPAKMFKQRVTAFKKYHPTTKPENLMEWCLRWFPDANCVFDPFMGSGTTGVACMKLGKIFIGVEKDQEYFGVAEDRIRKAFAENKVSAC